MTAGLEVLSTFWVFMHPTSVPVANTRGNCGY